MGQEKNPWEQINLNDYENHMRLENVSQLQTMNRIMKGQFESYPIESVMILGVAGGNGLEHINPQTIKTVYGVDINNKYLEACRQRYPKLNGILQLLCVDLNQNTDPLPYVDLVVANLVIEYIGYDNFIKVLKEMKPEFVSCTIQINQEDNFISDSPYTHVFDHLEEVLHSINEKSLIVAMEEGGYNVQYQSLFPLPNGKRLMRVDFARKGSKHFAKNTKTPLPVK